MGRENDSELAQNRQKRGNKQTGNKQTQNKKVEYWDSTDTHHIT